MLGSRIRLVPAIWPEQWYWHALHNSEIDWGG